MTVGEITSNGFTVGNARYRRTNTTSSADYDYDEIFSLNDNGSTYFYLAVK